MPIPSGTEGEFRPDRRRLLVLLGVALTVGFLVTTFASYFVSRGSLRETIAERELPLVSDNVYSEIQRDLIRPILISSTMASDTFLRDWVIAGEQDVERITRYLKEIKTRFGAFTSFFISDRTLVYYHADGILKTVSRTEPRDVWYFRVREMKNDHEINVDPDLANADAMTIFINYRVFDYEGGYIGAAGVGLTVTAVQDLIRKYRARFARDIYFVDQEGKIVLAEGGPAPGSRLAERRGLAPHAERLLSGDVQAVQFEVDGVTRFLKIRFVPELNWFLCVEKDEAGAIADIRRALYLNLLICLVVTAFAIGAITLFVNRYQTRLEMAATTDRLTGLANRHSYEILVAQALKEAERAPGPLSIALFDIDDFKKINDSRGHMVGDEVLRAVADLARASLREADILCRWGGEEFIAVLKNCGRDDAAILGEWIRTRIAAADLTAGPSPIRATVSVGVAQRAAGEDEPALMARADRALLAAKAAGKNMVRVD